MIDFWVYYCILINIRTSNLVYRAYIQVCQVCKILDSKLRNEYIN